MATKKAAEGKPSKKAVQKKIADRTKALLKSDRPIDGATLRIVKFHPRREGQPMKDILARSDDGTAFVVVKAGSSNCGRCRDQVLLRSMLANGYVQPILGD